jgi:hypothetical protein
MADTIQRHGVIKHPKPKSVSDSQDRGEISRQNFEFLKFFKIVSGNTHILDYIQWIGV